MPESPECAMKDCLLAPAFAAHLVLRAKSHRKALAASPLGVELCAGHAAETKIDDLVDDETWAAICAGFEKAGKVAPDRDLAELDMVPLNLEA